MTVVVRIAFNHLPKLTREMRPKAAAVVRETALNIERDAKERAPVRTGTLRRSIHTVPTGELSAEVGPSVEYGTYVELGTRKMAARPYLIPAAEAERPKFLARMKEIVQP